MKLSLHDVHFVPKADYIYMKYEKVSVNLKKMYQTVL